MAAPVILATTVCTLQLLKAPNEAFKESSEKRIFHVFVTSARVDYLLTMSNYMTSYTLKHLKNELLYEIAIQYTETNVWRND